MKKTAAQIFFIISLAVCPFFLSCGMADEESHDEASASSQWHLKATATDHQVNLSWKIPNDPKIDHVKIYRSLIPTDPHGKQIANLKTLGYEYSDRVRNWKPYYYWVQAVDDNGQNLGTSNKVAAFAHPGDSALDRIETFAFWYEPYKPTTDDDSTARHIGHAAFVVGPDQDTDTMMDLKTAGVDVLSYISFYQTADWAHGTFKKDENFSAVIKRLAPVAFYRKNLNFPGSPPGYLPSIFSREGNVEYNPQSIQYTADPNSAPLREMALSRINELMDSGTSGFFVDNGYNDDIAASIADQSDLHAHYYGANLTSADAFLGLLMDIFCEVKKRNPKGIVMVNGTVPASAEFYGLKLGDVSDGQLWESYLRSSYSTLNEHVDDWDEVYRRSIEIERSWQAAPPHRMYVLSYPWDRNEAFFTYATAKLCDLPWSANVGITDPHHSHFGGRFGTYPELVNIHLGHPVNERQYGGEKWGEVYVRYYANGFVMVNPADQEQKFTLLKGHKKYREK